MTRSFQTAQQAPGDTGQDLQGSGHAAGLSELLCHHPGLWGVDRGPSEQGLRHLSPSPAAPESQPHPGADRGRGLWHGPTSHSGDHSRDAAGGRGHTCDTHTPKYGETPASQARVPGLQTALTRNDFLLMPKSAQVPAGWFCPSRHPGPDCPQGWQMSHTAPGQAGHKPSPTQSSFSNHVPEKSRTQNMPELPQLHHKEDRAQLRGP